MKKILVALAIAGCSFCSADAQSIQNIIDGLTRPSAIIPESRNEQIRREEQATRVTSCEISSNKVCKIGGEGRVSCYRTVYAENFKVCKGNRGYYICCETPGPGNSTHPHYISSTPADGSTYTPPAEISYYNMTDRDNSVANNSYSVISPADNNFNPAVPQSQSYTSPAEYMQEREYLGNYPQRHYIRVCYVGDNVAENNRNPYHGCASPQYDGPEKNIRRNEILPIPENPDFNAQDLK